MNSLSIIILIIVTYKTILQNHFIRSPKMNAVCVVRLQCIEVCMCRHSILSALIKLVVKVGNVKIFIFLTKSRFTISFEKCI